MIKNTRCLPVTMEERRQSCQSCYGDRSQSFNGERSQSFEGKKSDDYSNDDHGCAEERSVDSSDGHNSMNDALNDETKETLKQDRISTIPDEILLHILSFLPTKDSIKVSTLSQKWLSLWTLVPNFDLTFFFEKSRFLSIDGGFMKFAAFVNRTLIFHSGCCVNKFTLKFVYHFSFDPYIDEWVRFVISANVEEVCLLFSSRFGWGEGCYKMPQEVYTNSSATTLNFKTCRVAPDGLISWKSLKSLLIGDTRIYENEIQKILVGAPLLESLELYGCYGFNRLDIGSTSLRKLVVRDFWCGMLSIHYESPLEIYAPNLQSLGILGCMARKKLRLMNVQSLDDCNLNFWLRTHPEDRDNGYEVHRNLLRGLLERLGDVKKLTLGNWCTQVLSFLELKGVLSPLSKCNCLRLNTYMMKGEVFGISSLLQCSLNLETLFIKLTSFHAQNSLYKSKHEFDEEFPENYWASESGSSKCSLLHLLKTVEVVGCVARSREFGLVIPLVQFLLEKGRTLEKIVIDARRGNHVKSSPQKELLEVIQKLQSLPRISKNAVVYVLLPFSHIPSQQNKEPFGLSIC